MLVRVRVCARHFSFLEVEYEHFSTAASTITSAFGRLICCQQLLMSELLTANQGENCSWLGKYNGSGKCNERGKCDMCVGLCVYACV